MFNLPRHSRLPFALRFRGPGSLRTGLSIRSFAKISEPSEPNKKLSDLLKSLESTTPTINSRDRTSSDSPRFSQRSSSNSRDRNNSSWKNQTGASRYGSPSKFDFPGEERYGKSRETSVPVETLSPPKPHERLSYTHQSTMTEPEVQQWRKTHGLIVDGTTECPHPIASFDELPFEARVRETLQKKYTQPLPIQSQGWAVALSGKNMIGCADTGSGKTLAFVIPALEHVKKNRSRLPCVLVLAPSRELAQQIEEQFQDYARIYGIKTACVFGGAGNRNHQMRQLSRRPDVIVACPGRLLDFCSEGLIDLSNIRFLVLDEADRMLEMGFEEQVRDILKLCPKEEERQTTFWTATWPKAVKTLVADTFQSDFVKITVGSEELTANKNVTQKVMVMAGPQRLQTLLSLLKEHTSDKIIIFTNRKTTAAFLETQIQTNLQIENVTSLHGDKTQMQRNAIIGDFKIGVLRIVIATDLAARGLDVKDIGVVINYEMPQQIESYIHRIGRTARAGKKGTSYTFFTQEDAKDARELLKIIEEAGQEAPRELIYHVDMHRRSSGGSGSRGRSSGRGFGSDSRGRSSSPINRYGSNPARKSSSDWTKW